MSVTRGMELCKEDEQFCSYLNNCVIDGAQPGGSPRWQLLLGKQTETDHNIHLIPNWGSKSSKPLDTCFMLAGNSGKESPADLDSITLVFVFNCN